MKKGLSFTLDNILRELWERNLNLDDLKIQDKRKHLQEVVTQTVSASSLYKLTPSKDGEFLYHPGHADISRFDYHKYFAQQMPVFVAKEHIRKPIKGKSFKQIRSLIGRKKK